MAAQLMLELLRLPASGPGGMQPGMTAAQTEDLLTLQRDLVVHCITPSLQAAGSVVLAPATDGSRAPSPKGSGSRGASPRSAGAKKGPKLPPGRPASAAAAAGGASSPPPAAAVAATAAAGHRAFCTALFEARSLDGSTLLMAAAAQGALALVTQLLDVLSASAPVVAAAAATAVNKHGEGALHCAALGGHLEVISLLLSRTPLRLTGERALDVAGRGPLDLCSATDRTLLQQLHLPNTDGSLLDEITFPLQDECPEVIFSYASRTDDEKGTAWMWMLASLLREAGITSYNARQTPVGGDWLKEWFGRMPDCKICVAMFSPAYFESDKCKNELYEARRAAALTPTRTPTLTLKTLALTLAPTSAPTSPPPLTIARLPSRSSPSCPSSSRRCLLRPPRTKRAGSARRVTTTCAATCSSRASATSCRRPTRASSGATSAPTRSSSSSASSASCATAARAPTGCGQRWISAPPGPLCTDRLTPNPARGWMPFQSRSPEARRQQAASGNRCLLFTRVLKNINKYLLLCATFNVKLYRGHAGAVFSEPAFFLSDLTVKRSLYGVR